VAQAETFLDRSAVDPLRIDVPEEELLKLHWRIAATQWPDKRSESRSSRLASRP